jgi:V8-like Glu-specific endopeptidase
MTYIPVLYRSLLLLILTTLLASCGASDGGSGSFIQINNATLPDFKHVDSAPPAIQTAAKAVVRIGTAGAMATGFFISGTGLLLTNDHVLGDTVCAKEGCYIEIDRQHQRGVAYRDNDIAFAVPIAVDNGLDMALVQLYNAPGGTKLSTPDYLTLGNQTSTALVGTHITVVGHPEGTLKKWTDGVVVNTAGKWFQATSYILPGDSGSPVLNDAGLVVGLIHRGPASTDLFTASGANVYSIGTAAAYLAPALSAPLPATMTSTTAPTNAASFIARNRLYLNARSLTVTADGVVSSPLTLLGSACDAALARQDYTSPNDMDDALSPCYDAQYWIDCRSDASSVSYGRLCPSGGEATSWYNRFKGVSQRWQDLTGQPDYHALTFAIARLQPNFSSGVTSGGMQLQQVTAANSAPLDLSLAYYFAAFNIASYGAVNIKEYVSGYAKVSHYELSGTDIAYALAWLYSTNRLTKLELSAALNALGHDPLSDVGTRLAVEEISYQFGLL